LALYLGNPILQISKEKQMRKIMIMVAVLGIGWAAQGCKKESPLSPSNELNAQTTKAPKVENGCLVFETNEQFSYYLEKTSNMTYEERLEWENSIGFRSLSTIESQANDIEVERMDAYFEALDIPDDLNGHDYSALSINYEPSDYFNEYVAKGVLITFYDDNGNKSTELSVKNRSFIHLLNERGEVIVEGIKTRNEGNMTYLIDVNKNTVIHEYEVFKQNSDEKLANQYWMTKGLGAAGQRDGWIENGNFRYKSWVYCYSTRTVENNQSNFPVTTYRLMHLNHYIHTSAEQKRWGSWARRSSYSPITFINLQFSYEVLFWDSGVKRFQSTPPFQSDYNSASPMKDKYPSHNSGYIIFQQVAPNGTNNWTFNLAYNGNTKFYNDDFSGIFGGFISALRLYHPWNYNEFGGFYQTTISGTALTHQL